MLLLLVAAACAQVIPRSISLIVAAADAAAADIAVQNALLLSTLPDHVRAGVDPADSEATIAAVRTQQHSAAWRKKAYIAFRDSARRVVAEPQAVTCQQPVANGARTFRFTDFLGAKLLLSGDSGVDVECDGLDPSDPTLFEAQLGDGRFPFPLEVVQTTIDTRLKHFFAFLRITNARTFAPRVQAGMAHALLPAMTSFQQFNVTLGEQGRAGDALYDGVESPITFISEQSVGCAADASGTRFATQTISWIAALGSRDRYVASELATLDARGAVFGQCAPEPVRGAIRNNASVNFVGGVVFVDVNGDGIRQPLEDTIVVPSPLVLEARSRVSAAPNVFLATPLPQNANGAFLRVVPYFNGTPPEAFVVLRRPIVGIVVPNFANVSSICGTRSPLLGPTQARAPASASQDLFFAHASAPTTQEIIAQTLSHYREPTANIAVRCQHHNTGHAVFVGNPTCGAATLAANQTSFVDTYLVEFSIGAGATASPPLIAKFLITSATRPRIGAPIVAADLYTVLPHSVQVALSGVAIVYDVQITATPQGTYVVLTAPNYDVFGTATEVRFNVSITTAYARGATPCAGVAGEEVVSEFILSYFDRARSSLLGDDGAVCRHRQPAECVAGGPATPAPAARRRSSGLGALAIAAIVVGVIALLAVCIGVGLAVAG